MARKKYSCEIEEADYERFKKIAKYLDSTAIQEMRKFIKRYNAENSQLDLKI